MKTVITILTILISCSLFSQKVGYFYDDVGNREQRKLCPTCRLAAPDSTFLNPISQELTLDVSVYPSPTKGKVNVQIKGSYESEDHCHVMVYDVYGKEIINKIQTLNSFILDLEEQKKGIYFIRLMVGEESKQWKITRH